VLGLIASGELAVSSEIVLGLGAALDDALCSYSTIAHARSGRS
jgi:hypothetical protein